MEIAALILAALLIRPPIAPIRLKCSLISVLFTIHKANHDAWENKEKCLTSLSAWVCIDFVKTKLNTQPISSPPSRIGNDRAGISFPRHEAGSESENMKTVICPSCASSQIHASRRGFDGGLGLLGLIFLGIIGAMFAGVGGVLVLGGAGLLNGFSGAGNIELTCLTCGQKGKPQGGRS